MPRAGRTGVEFDWAQVPRWAKAQRERARGNARAFVSSWVSSPSESLVHVLLA